MLNDKRVAAAKPKAGRGEAWLSDGGGRGQGRLMLRVLASGSKRWYFRYTDTAGKRAQVAIGDYTDDGRGVSLAKARDEAARMRALHRAPESHDVREYLAAQDAKWRAEEAAQRAREESAKGESLRALLAHYVAYLERAGKQSAADARGMFARHVLTTALAERSAGSITALEFTELLRRVTDAGKLRTAGKLRSYLRAAYALAARAVLDPTAPADLVRFNVQANPVAPIATMAEHVAPRDRVLTRDELRAYMRRIDGIAPMQRALLWLALLLGGQRPAQVLRLRVADVDFAERTIRLFDGKGKRKAARVHLLPITGEAEALLRPLIEQRTAEQAPEGADWLFTSDGKVPMRLETVSAAVQGIAQAMRAAREAKEHFQMRDVRRTCETMLAAMGISKDVRAQILSHGLSGVQERHYDRHDYMREKRAALEAWAARLRELAEGRDAADNVVPLVRAA